MQNAVDLVVFDWHMPKISGIELLKVVRLNEEKKALPFLMVTSTSDLTAVKNALDSGVSDYMIKPFQPAQLGFRASKLLTKATHKAKKLPVQIFDLNVIEEKVTETATVPEKAQTQTSSNDHDGTPVDIEDII
jgi:DNA-binding response OmpR family regulator